MLCFSRRGAVLALALLTTSAFADDLRVATWNISNYTGSDRTSAIQNAVYGSFQGRSFSPDVIFAQEIQSNSAANQFVNVLNSASGSPGDWSVTFGSLTGTSGTNASDSAMFFRTSKVQSVATVKVGAAAGTSGPPRDTWRFDFTINGSVSGEIFSAYNVHMKSGTTVDDQNRRQQEGQLIANNWSTLGGNRLGMVVGDLNVQDSSQAMYQTLTAPGFFADPIGTPGDWNNNSAFRFVHTQDPSGNGGMDDRHDQLLMSAGLHDGVGAEYKGVFGTAYSTTTWDDANHSYRSWGNDGTSFDNSLTVSGNTMVGSSIAQSLIDTAGTAGGHLPVFADITYSTVPEPATLAIVGLGAAALIRRRRQS
ncbi:MAG: PEP-CTERM sorting domain-containing protein [Armatimonadetes bacterium]|nr:PEP-CTERM sorting domain-containing protein [Armatimonadota bacterium]